MWKTPIGYGIVMADLIIGDVVAILCVLPTMCFGLGAFWFLKAFVGDITRDLSYLKVKKKTHGNDERHLEIHFCKTIRLYTDLKELRTIYNDNFISIWSIFFIFVHVFRLVHFLREIYEFQLFVFILWTFSNVCTLLLIYQILLLVEYNFFLVEP